MQRIVTMYYVQRTLYIHNRRITPVSYQSMEHSQVTILLIDVVAIKPMSTKNSVKFAPTQSCDCS